MALLAHGIFLFVTYWLTSIFEWFYHQYGMHASDPNKIPSKAFREICKRHIIHHSLTKDDMSLQTEKNAVRYDQYKIDKTVSKFQGLYFLWPATMTTYCIFAPLFIATNFSLKYLLSQSITFNVSYLNAIFYATLYCIYMNAMWNYIHPDIHFEKGLHIDEGLDVLPRFEWIKQTAFYRFLWKNHVLHHLCTGTNAGNYNVTFLGADWLFGTHRTECKGYQIDPIQKKIIKLKK